MQPELCIGADPASPSLIKCDASRLQSPLNVECAQCTSDFSEWQNTCMRCDDVHGGMVLLLMLISWSYVIFTHKLSQGAARLSAIFMHFVQMALLLGNGDGAAFASGVAWLNLFGMHVADVGGDGGWILLCLGPISQSVAVAWHQLRSLAQLTLTALIHWLLSSRVAVCVPIAASASTSSAVAVLIHPHFAHHRYGTYDLCQLDLTTVLAIWKLFNCSTKHIVRGTYSRNGHTQSSANSKLFKLFESLRKTRENNSVDFN